MTATVSSHGGTLPVTSAAHNASRSGDFIKRVSQSLSPNDSSLATVAYAWTACVVGGAALRQLVKCQPGWARDRRWALTRPLTRALPGGSASSVAW